MAKPKKSNPPVTYDAGSAAEAFEAVRAELDVIPDTSVQAARANLELATVGVLKVTARLRQMGLPERLATMPANELEPGTFDRIDGVAWAMLHASQMAKEERAGEPGRLLHPDIEARAYMLEHRMQACCEYHLGDLPETAEVVAFLREGGGYRDLANDLVGYARLYESHHDLVSGDRKNYDPGDVAEAKALAGAIYDALKALEEQKWADYRNRAWTLLRTHYDDVIAFGRAIYRREPHRLAALPSLYTLGRRPPRASAVDPAPVVEPE